MERFSLRLRPVKTVLSVMPRGLPGGSEALSVHKATMAGAGTGQFHPNHPVMV